MKQLLLALLLSFAFPLALQAQDVGSATAEPRANADESTEPDIKAAPSADDAAGTNSETTPIQTTATVEEATPATNSSTENQLAENESQSTVVVEEPMEPIGLDPLLHPRVWHWDLNLEVGGGFGFDDKPDHYHLARGRVGVFHLRDTHFFAAGATFESAGSLDWGVGAQFEYVETEIGVGLQFGAATNFDDRWQMHVALGYSVLGVDYDYMPNSSNGRAEHAMYFKLRIPFGYFSWGVLKI